MVDFAVILVIVLVVISLIVEDFWKLRRAGYLLEVGGDLRLDLG